MSTNKFNVYFNYKCLTVVKYLVSNWFIYMLNKEHLDMVCTNIVKTNSYHYKMELVFFNLESRRRCRFL